VESASKSLTSKLSTEGENTLHW